MSEKPSNAELIQYIDERMHEWGWDAQYEKQPGGYTLRDIANACVRRFGRNNVPTHPQSYKRFVEKLKARLDIPDEEEVTEAARLLLPENFPEWRAKFFKVPSSGEPFQTPKFQHAIFWVMHAATFKLPLPKWVITYLDEIDPNHPFPENINELITGKDPHFLSFLLLMAPRHGKTELVVHFIEHTFALDANKRIMFGNGTQKKSEGFIDNAIMTLLEGDDPTSEEFVRMYGPFRADNRPWSKMGFTLAGREITNKMYSMQPFGLSGNIRSFDADSIIGDDLADLNRSRSETTTDADYAWITTELMMRREWNTSLILTGSHVAVDTGDLFARLLNNIEKLNVGKSKFIVKTIPAHFYDKCNLVDDPEHTKCVLWPEGGRDYGFLEAKRAELDDDAMFEAVFNQVPVLRKMMYFPAHLMREQYVNVPFDEKANDTPPPPREPEPGVLDSLRSWREEVVCCGLRTFETMGFDPAASERQGASFSAAVVLGGCVKCGRRYIIDYWKDRQSPEMHPITIGSITAEYPAIAILNIEINAYQRALSRDPRMQEIEARSGFYIKEWNTDERKHDPIQGIPASARHVKSGMLSIPHRTIFDQEFAEPFVKEFVRWPQKPNDLVMAFWLADLAMTELIEDSRHVVAELMPGSEKYRSEWHDEITYEVDLSIPFDEPADYI